jgi:hypothetical protein
MTILSLIISKQQNSDTEETHKIPDNLSASFYFELQDSRIEKKKSDTCARVLCLGYVKNKSREFPMFQKSIMPTLSFKLNIILT